jgi:hypothetical protein
MLIMATSARSEIRTRRYDPLRRCLDHLSSLRADESRLLLNDGSFNFFSSQNKRKEVGLAPAAVVCGQVRETVPAVDEFLNGEQQY